MKQEREQGQELTTVILEGALGRKYGREWKLKVSSPSKALQLIEANHPGFISDIRNNLKQYPRYRVLVDGVARDMKTYTMKCRAKVIKFIPLIEGAGGGFRFVLGAVMVAIAIYTGPLGTGVMSAATAGMVGSAGVSLMIGGLVEMLTKTPKSTTDTDERKDKTSRYFDGPVNTEMQGVAIPLIYGRCLVGSHAISAKLVVEQVS